MTECWTIKKIPFLPIGRHISKTQVEGIAVKGHRQLFKRVPYKSGVCQPIGGEDLHSEPLVNSRGLGVKRPRTYKFDKMLKGKKKKL
jgi:hypothetical protein